MRFEKAPGQRLSNLRVSFFRLPKQGLPLPNIRGHLLELKKKKKRGSVLGRASAPCHIRSGSHHPQWRCEGPHPTRLPPRQLPSHPAIQPASHPPHIHTNTHTHKHRERETQTYHIYTPYSLYIIVCICFIYLCVCWFACLLYVFT